jgi:type IV secretory pathway VirB2 component (pilin)
MQLTQRLGGPGAGVVALRLGVTATIVTAAMGRVGWMRRMGFVVSPGNRVFGHAFLPRMFAAHAASPLIVNARIFLNQSR